MREREREGGRQSNVCEKAHGVAEGDGFLVGDGGGVHVCTMHLRSGGNDAAVSVT